MIPECRRPRRWRPVRSVAGMAGLPAGAAPSAKPWVPFPWPPAQFGPDGTKIPFPGSGRCARPGSNGGPQSARAGSAQAAVPDGTAAGAGVARPREHRVGFIGGRPGVRRRRYLLPTPTSPPVRTATSRIRGAARPPGCPFNRLGPVRDRRADGHDRHVRTRVRRHPPARTSAPAARTPIPEVHSAGSPAPTPESMLHDALPGTGATPSCEPSFPSMPAVISPPVRS